MMYSNYYNTDTESLINRIESRIEEYALFFDLPVVGVMAFVNRHNDYCIDKLNLSLFDYVKLADYCVNKKKIFPESLSMLTQQDIPRFMGHINECLLTADYSKGFGIERLATAVGSKNLAVVFSEFNGFDACKYKLDSLRALYRYYLLGVQLQMQGYISSQQLTGCVCDFIMKDRGLRTYFAAIGFLKYQNTLKVLDNTFQKIVSAVTMQNHKFIEDINVLYRYCCDEKLKQRYQFDSRIGFCTD